MEEAWRDASATSVWMPETTSSFTRKADGWSPAAESSRKERRMSNCWNVAEGSPTTTTGEGFCVEGDRGCFAPAEEGEEEVGKVLGVVEVGGAKAAW